MKRIGIFSGTFDPLHNGHVWVIQNSLKLFDELHVRVGQHPRKTCLFNVHERLEMVQGMAGERVQPGILEHHTIVDFANSVERKSDDNVFIVRGVRDSDFQYEMGLYHHCRRLGDGVDYVFVPADPGLNHISSSSVKKLCARNEWGKVQKMVPEPSFRFLLKKDKYGCRDCDNFDADDDKTHNHFNALVNNDFLRLVTVVAADKVRSMLDPFPVDVVVSETFVLRRIMLSDVQTLGGRHLDRSKSLGPIIVDANVGQLEPLFGSYPNLRDLGASIVIEGKHRYLDALDRGERTILAWVGDRVNV